MGLQRRRPIRCPIVPAYPLKTRKSSDTERIHRAYETEPALTSPMHMPAVQIIGTQHMGYPSGSGSLS